MASIFYYLTSSDISNATGKQFKLYGMNIGHLAGLSHCGKTLVFECGSEQMIVPVRVSLPELGVSEPVINPITLNMLEYS